MTRDRILIIDGLNQFIRNWVIVPTMDSNGNHVGGLVGFLRSLKLLMADTKPTRVIVVWDGEGGSAKRHGIYAGYKDGRKPRVNREYDFESPEESQINMKVQHAKLKELLELLGVTQIELEGVEADDVIAFLCRGVYGETDKVVVSTDRDFLQLVDKHTLICSPVKKIYYTTKVFVDEWKILPENFVYFRAMQGNSDGADNIEGVKGIGPKTALKLFPFLAERAVELNEILSYAEANASKSPRYKAILEKKDEIVRNVQLMQLTIPIIGLPAIRAIRYALETDPTMKMSEFKILMLRDGIQLTDVDFFPTFDSYRARAAGAKIK